MNFKSLRFSSKIIWKAFWSHPFRQVLVALFAGLSIALVWLGWDMHIGVQTFLQKAWSGTGIPFTIVSTGELHSSRDALFSTTREQLPYDVYTSLIHTRAHLVALPWVVEEKTIKGIPIRIGYTDLHQLIQVRPWYVLDPQKAPLYILKGFKRTVLPWLEKMNMTSLTPQGTLHYPRHDFHVLIDIKQHPALQTRGLQWVEGRWFDDEQSFRRFARKFRQEYPVQFRSDNPSLARFSAFSGMVQGFVSMTGIGLAVFAYLALALILFHETRIRRKEWAILLATGIRGAQLRQMWIGFGILWTGIVFLSMNIWYWIGRFLFQGLLPDILIRPSFWEGPVITILSSICIFICLIPGYNQLYKHETLLALRAE